MPLCRGCGKEIQASVLTCPLCGAQQERLPPPKPSPSSLKLASSGCSWMVGILFGLSGFWVVAQNYVLKSEGPDLKMPIAVLSVVLAGVLAALGKIPSARLARQLWCGGLWTWIVLILLGEALNSLKLGGLVVAPILAMTLALFIVLTYQGKLPGTKR